MKITWIVTKKKLNKNYNENMIRTNQEAISTINLQI